MSVTLKVGSKTAALDAAVAKTSGNTYWALGGPAGSRFGVKVPAMTPALPAEVELLGVKVALKHGSHKDGRKQAAAYGIPVEVSGVKKAGKVVITDHGNGTWQVTAAVFAPGSGGGAGGVRTDLFA